MSIISNEIQNTINRLEQQKKIEIERAKQEATQRQIVPFNADIDTARSKAIAEITEIANAEISAIQQDANARIAKKQEELSIKKNELIEAGEKKKTEHANTTIIAVEAQVGAKYDAALKTLYEVVENNKE